jgi:hypothetical protein
MEQIVKIEQIPVRKWTISKATSKKPKICLSIEINSKLSGNEVSELKFHVARSVRHR